MQVYRTLLGGRMVPFLTVNTVVSDSYDSMTLVLPNLHFRQRQRHICNQP